MQAWIIKTETYDPKLAAEIVADQRTKGYTARIEDEGGRNVDEPLLNGRDVTKRPLSERLMAPLFVLASMVAAIFILYLLGLWVDHG
jgi:ribosomal protein L34